MIAKAFTLGAMEVNSYILHGEKEAYIIDPGWEPEALLAYLAQRKLQVLEILLTHGHIDHIEGLPAVLDRHPGLTVRIHRAEEAFLQDPYQNLSQWLGSPRSFAVPQQAFPEEDRLFLEGQEIRLIHTPGHSPGGVGFHCPADSLYIGGDLLFRGSVGRTDFPHSSPEALMESLRRILDQLPDDCRILPGHGPETTLARERAQNPYLQALGQG